MLKTKIVFVHIPKTAGTTLDFIIRQNFRESESFRIYGGALKSTYPEIVQSNRANDTNTKIFMGHFFFGLHCKPSGLKTMENAINLQ